MNIRPLIFLIILFSGPCIAVAQIDDVGLWVSGAVTKKITRKVEVSLGEQIRLNHDVTQIDLLLTDAGVEYNFTKKLKAGLHYRYIKKNMENYYSTRHRFYFEASYKEKFSSIALILRERIQEQYNDYNSSENGEYPIWTLRSKLTAKVDLDKKYAPYIAAELYYLLDNAKEADQYFPRIRYEMGLTYEFNRTHSINPYLLYQRDLVTGFSELIYGLGYDYAF
jgi:hypothetical protein